MPHLRIPLRLKTSCLIAALAGGGSLPGWRAEAATMYWDGSTSNANGASDNTTTSGQNWLSGGNWDNGTTSTTVAAWTAGNDAVFGGTAASQTVTAGTLTVGNMTFGQGPAAAGTSGTAYTISGGTITLGAGSTITTNTNATINSALAGSGGGLTKEGAGMLTLTAANSYTGATIINAGTLRLLRATTTTTSGFTVNAGGTLDYNTNGSTWGAPTAPVNLNGGTLSMTANSGAGRYMTGGPLVTVNATSFITINTSTAGSPNASSLFLDNGLTGSADLTVTVNNNGVGLSLRSAATNYSGKMTVNGNASAAVGAGSGLGLGTGLTLTNADIVVNGTMELGNSGMNWAAGTVTGTTLQMDALGGTGVVVANGVTRTLSIGNNGGGDTFSGVIAAGTTSTLNLTKNGSGTQILTGTNTYTGATVVSAGTLEIGGAGSLGSGGVYAGAITNNGTLRFNTSANQTLSGLLSGSGGLTKDGTGTLTINNNNNTSNTLTGTITVNAGKLSLVNGTGPTGNTNKVATTAVVALGGGTLEWLTSDSGYNQIQDLAGVSINAGSSSITGTNTGTASSFLRWTGNMTRSVGGTVDINPVSIFIGTLSTTTNTNGIAGGFATFQGNTWAVYGLVNNSAITGLASYTAPVSSTPSANVDVTANATLAGADSAANTLRFNTAADTTLTLTGNAVITSGGILVTSNVGAHTSTISGGTSLAGAAGADLIVIQNNTNANGALTIATKIVDNTSATGLTKSGAGKLILTGANTYTGNTAVNAGTLEIAGTGSLGAGGTYAGNITLGADATFLYSSSAAQTLSGTITAGGAAGTSSTFAYTGGGTLTLTGGLVKDGTTLILAGNGNSRINHSGGITGANPNSDLVVDGVVFAETGTSNYNGPTTVKNNGTFLANASVTTTAVTVNTGGTLGGNGTLHVAGAVSIAGDGFITGGEVGTIDTLRIDGAGTGTFDLAGTYLFDVNYGTQTGDVLNLAGSASVNLDSGGTGKFKLNTAGAPAAGAHYAIKIFQSDIAATGVAGGQSNYAGAVEGLASYQSIVTWDGGKTYYLVPEPASFMLLSLGSLLLLRRPTRRRGRATV